MPDEEMRKERVRARETIVAMIARAFLPSKVIFSVWVSWRRVKKELAVLTLDKETSLKEPEGV